MVRATRDSTLERADSSFDPFAVQCPSPTLCVVIGRAAQLVALTWNSGKWSAPHDFYLSDFGKNVRDAYLPSLSCTSINWCIAVGQDVNSGVQFAPGRERDHEERSVGPSDDARGLSRLDGRQLSGFGLVCGERLVHCHGRDSVRSSEPSAVGHDAVAWPMEESQSPLQTWPCTCDERVNGVVARLVRERHPVHRFAHGLPRRRLSVAWPRRGARVTGRSTTSLSWEHSVVPQLTALTCLKDTCVAVGNVTTQSNGAGTRVPVVVTSRGAW